MTSAVPRLRMIAGPNGSGKSTIKAYIPSDLLGIYINPDEIQLEIQRRNAVNLGDYSVETTPEEIAACFQQSGFWKRTGLSNAAEHVKIQGSEAIFTGIEDNSYLAALTADFIRQKLVEKKVSFTFETVMSHPSKVELLKLAQGLGYRTYLYYIATDDAAINISRVKARVRDGGHHVSEEKIESRYHGSLALLKEAITHTNRAYIFDNSKDGAESIFIAEITEGKAVEFKHDPVPSWFTRTIWDGPVP